MPIEMQDLLTLKRPELLRAVKLTASLQNRKIKDLTLDIAKTTGEPPIENLTREAIPMRFREGLWTHFENLGPAAKLAIAEQLFPERNSDTNFEYDTKSWQTLLSKAVPGIDLAAFGAQSFDELPDWPKDLHYLLVRKHKDDCYRVSHMKIAPNAVQGGPLTFMTLRKNRFGQNKQVRGIALRQGNQIYTIGQVDFTAGLRFSSLTILPVGEGKDARIDLYGLRLGRKANTEYPSSHIVYARHLTHDSHKEAIGEWIDLKGSVYRDNSNSLSKTVKDINEIRSLLMDSQGRHDLQPLAIDD